MREIGPISMPIMPVEVAKNLAKEHGIRKEHLFEVFQPNKKGEFPNDFGNGDAKSDKGEDEEDFYSYKRALLPKIKTEVMEIVITEVIDLNFLWFIFFYCSFANL